MDLIGQLIDGVIETMEARGLRLAIAEATVGGDICQRFSQPKNSRLVIAGGICTNGHIWERLVAAGGLPRFGASPGSPEAARAIAEACAIFFDAQLGVSIIPDETDAGPPGALFVHVAWDGSHAARRFAFSGGHYERAMRAAEAAAAMIANLLNESDQPNTNRHEKDH
jgi:nicotinamide mononucleotide (NMN) deamidase PncC